MNWYFETFAESLKIKLMIQIFRLINILIVGLYTSEIVDFRKYQALRGVH